MVEVPEEEEDFDFCFKAEDDKAIIIPTKIQDQEALIDKDKDLLYGWDRSVSFAGSVVSAHK